MLKATNLQQYRSKSKFTKQDSKYAWKHFGDELNKIGDCV